MCGHDTFVTIPMHLNSVVYIKLLCIPDSLVAFRENSAVSAVCSALVI